jgi:hypothetical protein
MNSKKPMTFEQMYEQATQMGYSLAQMKTNCLAQLEQYETGPASWRDAVPRCREALKWLDQL